MLKKSKQLETEKETTDCVTGKRGRPKNQKEGEHLTDLEVDEVLAAWDRKVELEKIVEIQNVSGNN